MPDETSRATATVFYSWQSDLPNRVNRGFIQQALERAAKELRNDDSITVEPVVDRDTSNVAGAPDIAGTIFEKIERASVLVCDVSIVSANDAARPAPNPNVLIELGFGLHALGWGRVLLVMNEAFGGPTLLPFDLKMKRVIVYRAEDGPSNTEERGRLSKRLEEGLRLVLKDAVGETSPQARALDVAARAVEGRFPDEPAHVKAYMSELARRLDATKPPSGADQADEALVAALAESIPIATDFARLAEVVGRMGSKPAALAIVGGFERILQGYDFAPRQGGSFRSTDFDFHKFLGHELFVVLVAALMRHDRWEILAELLDESLCVESNSGLANQPFQALSVHVQLLEMRSERLDLRRVSLHADLLKERHTQGELAKASPWNEFLQADYLLYLRTELQGASEAVGLELWRPWSVIFFKHTAPRFLVQAERRRFAERLLPVLGVPTIESLRARYAERGRSIEKLYRSRSPFFEVTVVDAQRLGSR